MKKRGKNQKTPNNPTEKYEQQNWVDTLEKQTHIASKHEEIINIHFNQGKQIKATMTCIYIH